MELTPCKTLYINNLNEKIRKEVAKKTLYALFSQFGRILEIVACRGKKLRGQVRISFYIMTPYPFSTLTSKIHCRLGLLFRMLALQRTP